MKNLFFVSTFFLFFNGISWCVAQKSKKLRTLSCPPKFNTSLYPDDENSKTPKNDSYWIPKTWGKNYFEFLGEEIPLGLMYIPRKQRGYSTDERAAKIVEKIRKAHWNTAVFPKI